MAGTFVQGAFDNTLASGASDAKAFTSNNTAGNLGVLVTWWANLTGTVSSVTDTAGNTWTQAIAPVRAGTGNLSVSAWYCPSLKAGANTVTANYSASFSFPRIIIGEWSGASVLDLATGAAASVTGQTASASETTTSFNDLLIGFGTLGNSGTLTLGSGWTSRITDTNFFVVSDQNVSVTGSYTASTTGTGAASTWAAAILAFKLVANVMGELTWAATNRYSWEASYGNLSYLIVAPRSYGYVLTQPAVFSVISLGATPSLVGTANSYEQAVTLAQNNIAATYQYGQLAFVPVNCAFGTSGTGTSTGQDWYIVFSPSTNPFLYPTQTWLTLYLSGSAVASFGNVGSSVNQGAAQQLAHQHWATLPS